MITKEKPLIILEMANNHMGNLEHGELIIEKHYNVCKKYNFDFAFKFQYRDLDTFIHKNHKDRMDLKFVKRFTETRLKKSDFLKLLNTCDKFGFKKICTPFDENSVNKIEEHNIEIIKVASCSVNDWPLLERIALTDKPIIVSTGGADSVDIDKIVSFFSHKNKKFALMHCIGLYPTQPANILLNRIDWLQKRYPNIEVGYSTHEAPDNYLAGSIAVGKKVRLFEKHVAVETDQYKSNQYSVTPEHLDNWLKAVSEAFIMCGAENIKDFKHSSHEINSLRALKRGGYAKHDIPNGKLISENDLYFAMPNLEGQMTADVYSKHNTKLLITENVQKDAPIINYTVMEVDIRSKITKIIHEARGLLNEARIAINKNSNIELSHHYGIGNIKKVGAVIIDCINRKYCKKIIIQVPGQVHPEHYHAKKEEAFQILYGEIYLAIDGEEKQYLPGDIILLEPGKKHSFRTEKGLIFEEISTTHYSDDSFYSDPDIMSMNQPRKTNLKDWWLKI